MDRPVGRDLALDGIEKANEFLMPVALQSPPTGPDPPASLQIHIPLRIAQRRTKRRRAKPQMGVFC
jgi:hypothetical protein